jgi:hypothetical protein
MPARIGENLKMIANIVEYSPAMTKGKMVDKKVFQLPVNS